MWREWMVQWWVVVRWKVWGGVVKVGGGEVGVIGPYSKNNNTD